MPAKLSPKEVYEKVREIQRKSPTTSVQKAARSLGATEWQYYAGRRQTMPKSPKPKVKKQTVESQPIDSGKLMVLIGTIEQIRGVIQ